MLYQNCRELSCHLFNEICVTGNLNFLVKDNDIHTNDELIARWHLIIDEFNELTKNTEAAKEFKNRVEVIYLNNLLYFLHFVDSLKQISLDGEIKEKIDVIIKVHKIKDVKKLIAKSNNRLNLLISQFEKEKLEISKVTTTGFEEVFAELIADGTSFNRYQTTTSEFAFLLNILKKKANKNNHKK